MKMRRLSHVITAMLLGAARVTTAQSISTAVQAAEAEGANFPRIANPTTTASVFRGKFGGTVERKCVASPASDDSLPGGSLRSGDFIIRARLVGPWGLHANQGHKILWFPLHNPGEYRDTLLIRAVRIDSAADSLRQSVANWAWSGPKTESGFPSTVRFPTAGEWLVVAATHRDWGCFLLTVA
jgi:hypothetical protein